MSDPDSHPPDPQFRTAFARRLLDWFADHARVLPWRRRRTPYRVWVAEVMLQQTRAETAAPYYRRFLVRFPSMRALAEAPLEDVLKAWEGLGYYARARNLHAAARQVMETHGGQLPDTFEELLHLPGVGRYTAGAVASIAFGRAVPAVDGNVRRVLCRVFEIREDVTRSATQRRLEALARDLLPPGRAGPFNEALMELGATTCTPRGPRCDRCPLRDLCRAYAGGDPEALPLRRPRRSVPHYDVVAAVITRPDSRTLVVQRRVDHMLGGLWKFPGGRREPGETLPQCLARQMREGLGVEIALTSDAEAQERQNPNEPLIVVRHAYTHFRITLHALRCRIVAGEPRCRDCAALRWATPAELKELPMSVADRKIAQALGASRQ